MAHSPELPIPVPVRQSVGGGLRSNNQPAESRGENLFKRFIPARGAIAGDHRLTRRNIYVLPSRAGMLFAVVLIAMLICSINYGLAMGYALTFLMFGVVVVGMMHTFRNLSALTLRPGRGEPVFAGHTAEVNFLVLNPSRLARYALRIHASGMKHDESIDVAERTEQLARISLSTGARGWLALPRFTVSTRYPLGIWRVWTYWQPAQQILVYPEPETPAQPLPLSRTAHGDQQGSGGYDEDLAGIRPFQQGDSTRRMAWSAMARTGTDELLAKQFEGGGTGELMLDYRLLPVTLGVEGRLSRLTRWVLDAEQHGARYALEIPGVSIAADNGPSHRAACLEALALFGVDTVVAPVATPAAVQARPDPARP